MSRDRRPPAWTSFAVALTGVKTVSQITEIVGGSDWSLAPDDIAFLHPCPSCPEKHVPTNVKPPRVSQLRNSSPMLRTIERMVFLVAVLAVPLRVSAATLVVATCDSAKSSKLRADFVGDCDGDQQEINAAIQALPPVGGTVLLMEGHYDIKAVGGTLGGVLINRSYVTLEGVGLSTRLRLADGQNTNVIRIIGNGTTGIVIQRLYIDGNFTANEGAGFELCGIKASSTGGSPIRNVTVQDTTIERSYRLNVMLDGINVRILNNHLGDARSDVAEILTGPGEMSNNYVEIASETGHALGTDSASTVTIANNIVRILSSGSVSQVVFRFWGGRYRNILSNNQVHADGPVAAVAEMNGYFNIVSGNVFSVRWDQRSRFTANAGSIVTGNVFQNIDINFKDTTRDKWPIALSNNFFYVTTVTPNTAVVVESNNIGVP